MSVSKLHGEQGSIVAMYHIIGLGADVGLSPTGKTRTAKWEDWMEKNVPYPPKNNTTSFDNMIAAFNSFLPRNDNVYTTKESKKGPIYVNALWVNTWINQALVIKNTINGNGNNWKYGWFDSKGKSFKGIPSTKTSHTLECIWDDIFSKNKDIKKELKRKDNWNPADTYLIKPEAEKTLHNFCDGLLQQFLSIEDKVSLNDPDLMKRFVGTVNMELCKLVDDGKLVPISLKKQTTKVTMTAKKTNIQPIPGGELNEIRGWFTAKPYCYCDVVTGKKGVNEIDFKGNSFFYKCHIKIGGYGTDYQNEQRMQGKSPDKAEVKDIRKTDGGDTKSADAQVGQVPSQKFQDLVKAWANVPNYDYNIPKVGLPFSDIQLNYWADEMDAISKERLSLGENGTTTIDLGKFEILGTSYTPREYWALLGRLDNAGDSPTAIGAILGENLEKGNFSAKMRNRCHQLRFMRALVNAYNSKMIVKGKGEAQLCMLLVRLYYLAAKMKMKDDDLQGPFYKVA